MTTPRTFSTLWRRMAWAVVACTLALPVLVVSTANAEVQADSDSVAEVLGTKLGDAGIRPYDKAYVGGVIRGLVKAGVIDEESLKDFADDLLSRRGLAARAAEHAQRYRDDREVNRDRITARLGNHPSAAAALVALADTNGDGSVDSDEREAFTLRNRTERRDIWKKNQNSLDDLKSDNTRSVSAGVPASEVDTHDLNNDGKIDQTEVEEFARRSKERKRNQESVDNFDLDRGNTAAKAAEVSLEETKRRATPTDAGPSEQISPISGNQDKYRSGQAKHKHLPKRSKGDGTSNVSEVN